MGIVSDERTLTDECAHTSRHAEQRGSQSCVREVRIVGLRDVAAHHALNAPALLKEKRREGEMEKEGQIGGLEVDEQRLAAADPDGLYLFMLEEYPYMMTPDHVAAFTGTTSQEIRKLLGRGEMQGCRIGIRWLVPKLGLLNYLYKDRRVEEGEPYGNTEMRQALQS